MPYFKIAESLRYKYKVELYEKGDTDPALNKELIVFGFKELRGINKWDKYKPHLPFELQVAIQDENSFFIKRIRNSAKDKFKVRAYDESNQQIGEWYVNTRFLPYNFTKQFSIILLSCFDGITLLEYQDPVDILQPVGKTIEQLLQKTNIAFDVIISSDLRAYNSGGQNGLYPNQYRCNPMVFVRNISNPTAYDQLIAILEYYKWQVFQEDSKWWVLERDSRYMTTLNEFNITQNTAATFDPGFLIQESDLRGESEEPRENHLDFVTSYERSGSNTGTSYKWENPDFKLWDADNTQPLYWDVGDPNNFKRIYENNEVGFQVVANGDIPYLMSQKPLYTVKSPDKVQFRFKCNFEWQSGLSGLGVLRVNLARFMLLQNDSGADRGLNIRVPSNDGEFLINSDGVLYDEIDTNSSYAAPQSFDLNFEIEMQARGQLLIELYFTGDTGYITTKPKYFLASFKESDIIPRPSTIVVSWSQPGYGKRIEDSVTAVGFNAHVEPSDFDYYDNTNAKWIDVDAWFYDDNNQFIKKLQEVISDKIIRSSQNSDHLLDLFVDYNTKLFLRNTIQYTLDGVQRKYIPIYIERNRLTKKLRLKFIQAKSESSQTLQVSYE